MQHDQDIIINCLDQCGFAIISDAYNITTLNTIHHRFFNQFTSKQRYPYKETQVHIRGKRVEYAIPNFIDIDGFEEIVYNPLIAESAMNFMAQKVKQKVNDKYFKHNPAVLDTMTFIVAPRNSTDKHQGWHNDAAFGIKLQIPLIDIYHNNGPIELYPWDGICDKIQGTVPKGTAILYQQTVMHRGSKNNHPTEIRPVIDMSFLLLHEHIETNYFSAFGKVGRKHMAKNQEIFYLKCGTSRNCPPTRKTYQEKVWSKKDKYKRVREQARAKARGRMGLP